MLLLRIVTEAGKKFTLKTEDQTERELFVTRDADITVKIWGVGSICCFDYSLKCYDVR